MITVINSRFWIILYILISFSSTDYLFAQDLLLPLSYSVIDNIAFDQHDIKNIGAEKANIVMIQYDLNRTAVDTALTMVVVFDSAGRIRSQSLIEFNGRQINEVYEYEDSIQKIKSTVMDSVLKAKYPFRPDWVETDMLFVRGKLVSRKLSGFFARKGTLDLVEFDTLIYEKDIISKEIYYYYKNEGALLDTSIIEYKYDTLGRIISKVENSKYSLEYSTWSFGLNTNQVYQSIYSYEKSKTRIDRLGVFFSNNVPVDTFIVSSYTIDSINYSPNLKICEIQNKNENYSHVALSNYNNNKIELLFNEIKKIEFIKNTTLPVRICLVSDDVIYIYNISYTIN